MCSLIPYKRSKFNQTFYLEPNKVLKCGRSLIEKNDIFLDDKNGFVSRSHCLLTYNPEEDVVKITNISKMNGTYVGKYLEVLLTPGESYELRDGDYVSLGGRFIHRKKESNKYYINPFIFFVSITKEKAEWPDAPDSVECPICITYLEKPVLLSCGHVFCFSCIDHWKRKSVQPKCPLCRHMISAQDEFTVHRGIQKCIDYMRLEKEDSMLFSCRGCNENRAISSIFPNGDCICKQCDSEEKTTKELSICKIINDVVHYKSKKRKREDV